MKRMLIAATLAPLGLAAAAAIDVDALWNFKDPVASEARFRDALHGASADDALVLRTQIARTLGLRGRFDAALRELDAIGPALDPRARGWRAAALNNIGDDQRQAGRLADSLASFRAALAACEQIGRVDSIRVARWQVANVLRLLGRGDEALAMQRALEREHAAAGAPDPYVFDELALLDTAQAPTWRAQAELARRAQPR